MSSIALHRLGPDARRQVHAQIDDAEPLGKRNKFGAQPVTLDGYRFDSQAEARRYQTLKVMHAAGQIADLQVHPTYDLEVNGVRIGRYEADFRYRARQADGSLVEVVEDVKSTATKTPMYRRNRKHMAAQYGIDVVEVLR